MSAKRMCLLCILATIALLIGGCPTPPAEVEPNSDPNSGDANVEAPNEDASEQPILVRGTARVRVARPDGLTGALTMWSGAGVAEMPADAADLPIFASEGAQLAAAFDATGNVVLLGWVDDADRTNLSARTTAEVLAYFDLGGWLLSRQGRVAMIEELDGSMAVTRLADQIGALLSKPAAHLAAAPDELNAARDQLVLDVLGKDGAAGLRVNPPDPQSGIRVNQPGLNSIVLTNTYRRRAVAFVDRLTPAQTEIQQIKLSPTVGATSVTNILADLAQGNIAYAPVDSELIPLELVPESAEETEYRVTVVGMGARLGALEELSATRTGIWGETIGQTLLLDFFCPLLANTLIPAGSSQLNDLLSTANADALVSTYISTVSQTAPNVFTKLRNGELRPALRELANAVATDGSVRLATFDLMLQLYRRAFTTSAGDRADFIDRANAINQIVGRFDAALTAIDSATQVVQIANSTMVETWDITVNRSRVVLTPLRADLVFGEQAAFVATVPDATGADAPTLGYRWSTAGNLGTLRDTFGQTGTDFESSRNGVSFIQSGQEEGTTDVTVEVFEIRGATRRSLGTATATVTVRALRPTLTPRRVALGEGESAAFTVSVPAALGDPSETYSYIWRTSGQFGGFAVGVADNEVSEATQQWHCRSDQEGTDTLSCEVLVLRDGQQVSLGEAEAEVEIEQGPRRSIVFGSFEYRQFVNDSGAECCQATWLIPKVGGAARYDIFGYNFNDPLFYGTSNRDSITEGNPRSRDGGGKFTPQIDEGGQYAQGLSGGCTTREGASAGICANLRERFAGIIVEVTVTYEEDE